MATTSIWSVKGWLGKLLIYVENPEKTDNPEFINGSIIGEQDVKSLADVIAYAVNEEKTRDSGNGDLSDEKEVPMQQYVSGINCSPMTARMEMMTVKKKFDKADGIVAFHGYQSFAPGECTPAIAHEIGVRLAEELWGERYQVLVATHLDKKNHLHNHFVLNPVSFKDGIRFHRTKRDYLEMRNVSDRLCREYALSVLEGAQKKGLHYGEWRAQQEGRPTYHGMVRMDVDDAISRARTEKQFFYLMTEKGYTYKVGKDITFRAKGRERGVKLARNFGEEYTMEAIRKRILSKPVNQKRTKEPEKKHHRIIRVKGILNKKRKIGGLRGLYLHYCYRLGILPKRRVPVVPMEIHVIFREDLCRLKTISEEARLLCHYRIDTLEQLFEFKDSSKDMMDNLIEKRQLLRNRIRNIRDEVQLIAVKAETEELTEQIEKLRKEIKLCDDIAECSIVINKVLKEFYQEMRREEKAYEYIRGCR